MAAIRADMRRRRLWVLWTRMLGASWLVLAAWLAAGWYVFCGDDPQQAPREERGLGLGLAIVERIANGTAKLGKERRNDGHEARTELTFPPVTPELIAELARGTAVCEVLGSYPRADRPLNA